ncbi:MAG: biopolymer transporter ExbD [Proteobacteria bacterium]|nr:biopolymer transporter ExbD [Pseudomonadota bacterium]
MKRMARNRRKIAKMNLTSLMDVFTILVFFLLVNSGSVEVMEAPKTIVLPESMVESKPRETVVILVSEVDVIVQGKLVMQVADIINSAGSTIEPITNRLAELQGNIIGHATQTAAETLEVTILADKAVPFNVVQKIMTTCTGQGYYHVSLAVIQKPSKVSQASTI